MMSWKMPYEYDILPDIVQPPPPPEQPEQQPPPEPEQQQTDSQTSGQSQGEGQTQTDSGQGTGQQQGQGQGQGGQGGAAPPPYLWDIQQGNTVVASGQTDLQAGLDRAITAAKARAAGLNLTDYGIVIRLEGATVYTEDIQAGTGGQNQGQGGGTGGQGQAGGGGQVADMGFRFILTGIRWVWTEKTAEDARLWKGHSENYEIQKTDYTYGSSDDALSAGRAIGDTNSSVTDVWSESNYPEFAGGHYQYNDRAQSGWNEGATESAKAYSDFLARQGTTTLKLPTPPTETAGDWLAPVAVGAIGLVIVALILWKSGILGRIATSIGGVKI